MKLLAASMLLSCTVSLAAPLDGYVFVDKNGNGTRDKNETGVKGVTVSDQVQVVVTDGDGHYQFADVKGFGYVFVSVPTEYAAVSSYWQKVPANVSLDFALQKRDTPATFSFIHASDTHISTTSAPRTQRLRSMADSLHALFVLISGDLVRDALRVGEQEAAGYYELYKKETQQFSMPVWSAAGNHENFGIERHLSLVSKQHPLYGKKMYRHYLGPNYYSFNYGGIHFIALDDVDFEDLWYYGHVDSTQVAWLKQDLATLAPTTPVVTFAHMPFFSGGLSLSGFEEDGPGRSLEKQHGKTQYRHVVSNAQEVVSILREHPHPLNLAGHFHARQTFLIETFGQQTRFEQTSAIVGPAEEGNVKIPSGFTIYTVKDGQISEGKFIRLYASGQ